MALKRNEREKNTDAPTPACTNTTTRCAYHCVLLLLLFLPLSLLLLPFKNRRCCSSSDMVMRVSTDRLQQLLMPLVGTAAPAPAAAITAAAHAAAALISESGGEIMYVCTHVGIGLIICI